MSATAISDAASVRAVHRNDADADPEVERAVAHVEPVLVHGPPETLGRDARAVERDPVQQDGELVAAEARDLVVRAHERADEAGQLDEDLVAGGVPERVVDDLEVVEVEEEEGRRRPAARARHGAHERILEGAAVGEVRERVVESEVADPLLVLLAGRDVLLDRDEVADLAVGRPAPA